MRITITGPRSIGKTKISKLLAKKMKIQYISSDKMGEKHFIKKGGLDAVIKSGEIKKIIKKEGYSLIKEGYRKEKNFVFDLSGLAFTSRKFKEASQKVREIAKQKSVVIGLLPLKNPFFSIWFLFKREIGREHFKDYKKFFILYKTAKSYLKFPIILRKNCDFVYIHKK